MNEAVEDGVGVGWIADHRVPVLDGEEVSNETIRRWVLKFGPAIARNLRRGRPTPHDKWHLDEMVVSIAGRRMYMWRAVDSEGEVLDVMVQPRRDKAAALKLFRKLLKRQARRCI